MLKHSLEVLQSGLCAGMAKVNPLFYAGCFGGPIGGRFAGVINMPLVFSCPVRSMSWRLPWVRAVATLQAKRTAQASTLEKLPEVRRRSEFREQLDKGECDHHDHETHLSFASVDLKAEDLRLLLDAGFLTFLLHCESRVANHVGDGFYTIGPSGEELLGAVGLALRLSDPAAPHYRHLSTMLVRALRSGKPIEDIVLDRARGYCVSSHDPVSGGMHCCLGGEPSDFVVTSTLASQTTPAVGRAAGSRLASYLRVPQPKFRHDAVSYVSLGDGSISNAHFLSAIQVSEYMLNNHFKCPVVFGISDNGVSISLKTSHWTPKFLEQRLGIKVFKASGNDLGALYQQSSMAIEYSRRRGAPAVVYMHSLARRFGHAATDRQDAYLTIDEIERAESRNALAGACARAVREGFTTYNELSTRFRQLQAMVEGAFDKASAEPKVNLADCVRVNSQPIAPVLGAKTMPAATDIVTSPRGEENPQVMRICMTRVLDEILASRPEVVYIGEDVEHGGYYKVTEGLRDKYHWRVTDFPPDETSLLGVGMGYSQAGLLPIVEIPYAKYLDCGADIFFEACIMNWLSAGKQPCGMVIRLQGFDKGVFGGNFHTHNSLNIPPGLDVIVHSNGADYARGFRYAVQQAAAGRIVMSVDSTDLLNKRHLFDKDGNWRRPYPADPSEVMTFDEVRTYGAGGNLAIVSYGNGVPTALIAQRHLQHQLGMTGIMVIDAPYLSSLPRDLEALLSSFDAVVFADVCKFGQHPHAGWVTKLQADGILPQKWRSVAAARTYNPLGRAVTFLSEDDIVRAATELQ